MTRALQIVLALLLVLPSAPMATALHTVPTVEDPEPPQTTRPDDVGVIQVDQKKDGLVDGANSLANRSAPLFGDAADARDQGEQALPAGVVELFRDGLEGDRRGAFGSWEVVGTQAWDPRSAAGGHVLTSGILEKGYYKPDARSLLVTPEIDLRTGAEILRRNDAKVDTLQQTLLSVMEVLGLEGAPGEVEDATKTGSAADTVTSGLFEVPDMASTSAIYGAAYTELALVLYAECIGGAVGDCIVPSPQPGYILGTDAAEPKETAITFSFDRRFNMAAGRDGVQVFVFSRPPTSQDVAGCRSREEVVEPASIHIAAPILLIPRGSTDCLKVQTVAPHGAPTRVFGEDPSGQTGSDVAYTGYDGWRREAIDLTTWAGESVWVGFLFASEHSVGDSYFRNPSQSQNGGGFNQTSGFYGFQLDNVSVTSPAPQTSLRVRPFSEPSMRPQTVNVTLPLGVAARLVADVGNMGTNPLEFELRLRLYERGDRSEAAFAASLGTVALEPGGVHRVDHELPAGLTAHEGRYDLVLEAVNTRPDATRPEAYPADDLHSLALDVFNVPRPPSLGILTRSATTIGRDGRVTFELPVSNLGNVPLAVDAVAQIIDAASGEPLETDARVKLDQPRLERVVAPGDTLALSWNATGNIPGQYRFFVRINNETGYSKEKDFRTAADVLESQWVDGRSQSPPSVNGLTASGEWSPPSNHAREFRDPYGRSDSINFPVRSAFADTDLSVGNVRVMNNDTRVWISVSVPRVEPWYAHPLPDQLALLFDDGADGLDAGVDDGVLSNATISEEKSPAIDLSFQDLGRVRIGDERLSLPRAAITSSSGDLGRLLADDERLSPYQASPTGILDLDGSELVSVGDYDVPGAAFVSASDPRVGTASGLEPLATPTMSWTAMRLFTPVLRFHDADGDGRFSEGDPLYRQPQAMPWLPEAASNWTVAAVTGATNVTYEFEGPLDGGPGDLQAGPGDELRVVVLRKHLRYPAAPVVDGEGLVPANGNLDDEVSSWAAIRLAKNATGPPPERLLGPGFGVERVPPPMLEVSLQDCDGLAGWIQTSIWDGVGPVLDVRSQVGADPLARSVDKWNCAPYGPDGKTRLYEGLAPDATCGTGRCPQWSGVAGASPVFAEDEIANPNDLITPPFTIGDVATPFLTVRHQYGTDLAVNDDQHYIGLMSVARVFVQERVGGEHDGTWRPPVLVNPEAGYSTEESNPSLYNGPVKRTLVSVGGNEFAPERFDPCQKKLGSAEVEPPCGWWAPTGFQERFRPDQQELAIGGAFSGSNWTVDRLPLFGFGHGFSEGETLELQGRTVRLIFEFYQSRAKAADPRADRDLGWRIEGLTVTEGRDFSRDVAVSDVRLVGQLYDPAELGLGPDTRVPVNVTVTNRGLLAASGLTVCLHAIDVSAKAVVPAGCSGAVVQTVDHLASGQSKTLTLPYKVPAEEGARLAFLARALVPAGDDFPADNELRMQQAFDVRASPDAAIVVDATPLTDQAGRARSLTINVVNQGNVNLTGLTVMRTVVRVDGAQAGTPALAAKEWTLKPLPVGREVDLAGNATTAPVTLQDLTFRAPGKSGAFAFLGQVRLAGDTAPADNSDLVTLRAVDLRYGNDFDDLDGVNPLDGITLPPEWSLQPSDIAGSMLVAGGLQGDGLALDADTSVELPVKRLDLRSARDAVLTLMHRYELEEGFDAARVEISTDGGLTWRPLRPIPHLGTPSGYPDITLTGTNALLDGQSSAAAVAFTGSSADVPGSDGGWLLSEFNLGDDPGLARPGAFEAFRLDGLPAHPSQTVQVHGQQQFTDPLWKVKGLDGTPEPGADVRQRYWWIQNISLEEPRPHSDGKMWWSGSAGDGAAKPVHDVLERTLVLPSGTTVGPDTQVLATWWEWRAGAADGGTGGRFTATLVDHARAPILLESDKSGWRKWAFDVTDLAEQPQELTLRFEYVSIAEAGFTDPLQANNAGWFLDDFGLQAFTFDAARGLRHSPRDLLIVETLETLDASKVPDGWASQTLAGHSSTNPKAWTLVGPGVVARDGGWHVEEVVLPGGPTKGWRFSDGSAQGYPGSADSRLVTPAFDLSAAAGDVRLEFDQRHWFEAETVCPFDGAASGCFRSALDGGAIEYQVFDPATGTFGPWQPLYANGAPAAVALLAETECPANVCPSNLRTVDRIRDASRTVLESTGYSALLPRGERLLDAGSCSIQSSPAGRGTTLATAPGFAHFAFDACDLPWRPYPVSYAFSGRSPGPGGWQRVSWDISPLAGQQVRFAFHAFSNPNAAEAPNDGCTEEEKRENPALVCTGWSIANVAAAGNAFEGQPVRLRLRVATDGSLRDGVWAIEDISLSGTSYQSNVVLVPSGTGTVEGAPGDHVVLAGNLTNLAGGDNDVNRLVLKGVAVRAGETDPIDEDLFDDDGPVRFAGAGTLETVELEGGNALEVDRLEADGGREPVEFEVRLPEDEADIELHFTILRNFTDAAPDYRPFVGERAANTQTVWHAKGVDRPDLVLVSALAGRAGPLVAEPASGAPQEPIRLSVGIENRGTTEPGVEVEWEIRRILHKGNDEGPGGQQLRQGDEESEPAREPDPDDEGSTRPFDPESDDLGKVARCRSPGCAAERVPVSVDFTPSEPGLYRATVRLNDRLNDGELAEGSLEFLVLGTGVSANYYDVDFARPGLQGWADDGASPASLAFRRDGDALRWGVTPTQYQEMTYCTAPGVQCVFPATTSDTGQAPMYDVRGLEGIAIGPPIALDLVPQGQAFLNLRHSLDLEAGDGARVELVPLRHSPDGEPGGAVWACADGTPLSFILVPEPASAYGATVQSLNGKFLPRAPPTLNAPASPAETIPNQINPLAPDIDSPPRAAFGGSQPGQATARFRLDPPVESACLERESGATLETSLINYTVQPILHVGTVPGYDAARPTERDALRAGALGWAVHRISVSSSALSVEPVAPTYTVLGGAPKEFLVTVRNDGQLQDHVRFELDTGDSTLPSAAWLALPAEPIALAPGETRRVKLGVAPPPGGDLVPGSYDAPILLRSMVDPASAALLDVTVVVPDREFADLVGDLDTDLDAGQPFRVDTIAPIHAKVFNLGARPSSPVEAVLEVVDPDGEVQVVGKATVPELCPRGRQGCSLAQGQATFSLEWAVPARPGDYQLRLRIDTGGRILEASKANNLEILAAPVAPLDLADLELTSLDIIGLGPGGIAQEGDVLSFAANVTNAGTVASGPFSLEILVMDESLVDKTLPGLGPGQSVVLQATRQVKRDHSVVSALVIPDGFDGNMGNNEVQRALRVRGSDLRLQPSGNVSLAPGGTADLRVAVENRGNAVEVILLKLSPQAQGWGLVADPNPVALAPGDATSVALHLIAPASAPAGLTVLRLQGVPSGGKDLAEVPINVTVEPRPGTPRVEVLPGSSAPGQAFVEVRLASASNVAQDLSVRVESPGWGSAPVNVTLPGGGEHALKLGLQVPGDAAVGAHDLVVIVAGRAGPDLARATAPFTVEAGPALSGTWSGAARSSGPELGVRTVAFDLKVRNAGNVPVRPAVTLRDLGEGLSGAGIGAGDPLEPGEEALLTVQVRLAADAQEALLGRADLWAVLDDGAERLAATLELPSAGAAPDLRVSSAVPSPRIGLKAGESVRVAVLVENHGDVEAPASVLFASANGYLVEPVDVPPVPAGGSVPVNVTMTFNKPGTYVLSFLADGTSSVAEADDGDNGVALDVEVGEAGLADRALDVPAPGPGASALALLAAALLLLRRRGGL